MHFCLLEHNLFSILLLSNEMDATVHYCHSIVGEIYFFLILLFCFVWIYKNTIILKKPHCRASNHQDIFLLNGVVDKTDDVATRFEPININFKVNIFLNEYSHISIINMFRKNLVEIFIDDL